VPQLVHHLDLLYEVLHCFFSNVPLSEFLDGDLGAEPLGLEDVAVAAASDEVVLRVER
jgi:hypothetical protein